jgi:CheY-like chemotaxis protein
MSVELILEHEGGYELTRAMTLQEMWMRLGTESFEAILLDIHLPDGNGLDQVPLLRARCPGTFIVPLTIEKDPDYVATHSSVGVDGWVTKGIGFEGRLTSVLRRLLDPCNRDNPKLAICSSHLEGVEIVFLSSTTAFSRREREYLLAVVDSAPWVPDSEARYQAAELLGISPTSLKDHVPASGFPSFGRIQRALVSALAAVAQRREPRLSSIQVANKVSRYSSEVLNRVVHTHFEMSLGKLRELADPWSICSSAPIPISCSLAPTDSGSGEIYLIRIGLR